MAGSRWLYYFYRWWRRPCFCFSGRSQASKTTTSCLFTHPTTAATCIRNPRYSGGRPHSPAFRDDLARGVRTYFFSPLVLLFSPRQFNVPSLYFYYFVSGVVRYPLSLPGSRRFPSTGHPYALFSHPQHVKLNYFNGYVKFNYSVVHSSGNYPGKIFNYEWHVNRWHP